LVGGSEQNRIRQYLLPFGSDCFMFSFIKLALFSSFCLGVKFGLLHHEKNTG